jgi:alpha-glucosidase (family GH31 glycosyl hydrolase)
VHLPGGGWYDVLRHRVVHAGQRGLDLRNYHAGLGETPVFVRLHTSSSTDLLRAMTRAAH